MSDWAPKLYLSFEKERTQPSIDLVSRIDIELPKKIIDIGCGPGNSTNVLKKRWADATVVGLDSSPSMIEQAKKSRQDIEWVCADATKDLSHLGLFDIVFSNAVIQWLPEQDRLLSNLFNLLNRDGVLAVQVPYVKNMPIHTGLENLISTPKWKKYFKTDISTYSMYPADYYYDIICRLTPNIALWETDYYHIMNSHKDLVKWYSGSGLRPYLDCLPDEKVKEDFLFDYEKGLKQLYPIQKDGKVLFPFTRIFFTARKD